MVQALTGITEEALIWNGINIFSALHELLCFTGPAVLLGHAFYFDLQFINLKLSLYCGITLNLPYLDTALLARAADMLSTTTTPFSHGRRENTGHKENYTLEHLLQRYHLANTGRHNALGDARLTAVLFRQLLVHLNAFSSVGTGRRSLALQDLLRLQKVALASLRHHPQHI